MEDELEIEKLKAEYPEFFNQFSDEFLDFVFSKENSYQIAEICLENGIEEEEKIEKIAYYITLVLFDQIPKEKFIQTLINEIGLDFEKSKIIYQKVEESIFTKIPKRKFKNLSVTNQIPESKKEFSEKIITEETKKPPQKDIYREPIE
jgi:hypothetical protein